MTLPCGPETASDFDPCPRTTTTSPRKLRGRLCEAVGANRRTLHLGFLEVYGVPPMKYLSALRLCGARRSILAPRNREVRVTDIAMAWGFTHLGRFAMDYRSFFGELPSADRIPAPASPFCDVL